MYNCTECVSVYKNKGFKAAVIVNLFKGNIHVHLINDYLDLFKCINKAFYKVVLKLHSDLSITTVDTVGLMIIIMIIILKQNIWILNVKAIQ